LRFDGQWRQYDPAALFSNIFRNFALGFPEKDDEGKTSRKI
jgi:hypothetical protein